MKKVMFIISLVSLTSVAMAQTSQEEIDMVQAIFGMEKKAFVTEFMQLEANQSDAFWRLYYEYEAKRKDLGKERIQLLEKFANNYPNLDEATTESLLKGMMDLQSQNDKLIASYAKQIKKEIGVSTAAQFYQIEGYILSKIRTEILENIPVIEEAERM